VTRATLMEYGAERAKAWSYAEAVDARELRRALIERFGSAVLSQLAKRYLEEVQDNQPFSVGIATGVEVTLIIVLGWALIPQSRELLARALTLTYIGESRVAAFQDPSPTTEES